MWGWWGRNGGGLWTALGQHVFQKLDWGRFWAVLVSGGSFWEIVRWPTLGVRVGVGAGEGAGMLSRTCRQPLLDRNHAISQSSGCRQVAGLGSSCKKTDIQSAFGDFGRPLRPELSPARDRLSSSFVFVLVPLRGRRRDGSRQRQREGQSGRGRERDI